MNRIRLAAASLNQTPLAWEANRRHILAAIAAARDAGATVLCLPELCISGYGCEDMFHAPGVQRTALEMLAEYVPDTRGMAVCLGLPVFYEGAVYNTSAMVCDGRLLGIVAKQHLAGDGIHYEPRWFAAGSRARWARSKLPASRFRSAICCSTSAACGSASRSATTPGSRIAPARGSLARGRHPAQSQREPFCVWQAGCPRAVRARRLAGVLRELRLLQPAGQRIGPGDLRRRHADRQRRQDARPRPAVLVRRWVLTTALVDVTATRRARTAFYEKSDLVQATTMAKP